MYRLLAALILIAITLVVATEADAAFPGRNGAIAKGWSEGGTYYDDTIGDANQTQKSILIGERILYGCDEVYLGPTSACDSQSYRDPSFSADGARVVFDAGESLAVIGSDGEDFVLLRAHSSDDGAPAFAPDGQRIVSTAATAPGRSKRRSIWISDADGGQARRLVEDGSHPVWSSRNWIAFVRSDGIYRIHPNGRGLRLLARNAHAPAWSPDGTRLAFARSARFRHGQRITREGILVMSADRHRARRLRGDGAQDSAIDMAWSPDGRRLLVESQTLFTIDLHGKLVRDFGDAYYVGAEDVWQTNGIDWQPLPR